MASPKRSAVVSKNSISRQLSNSSLVSETQDENRSDGSKEPSPSSKEQSRLLQVDDKGAKYQRKSKQIISRRSSLDSALSAVPSYWHKVTLQSNSTRQACFLSSHGVSSMISNRFRTDFDIEELKRRLPDPYSLPPPPPPPWLKVSALRSRQTRRPRSISAPAAILVNRIAVSEKNRLGEHRKNNFLAVG